jgi:hypothetical protein
MPSAQYWQKKTMEKETKERREDCMKRLEASGRRILRPVHIEKRRTRTPAVITVSALAKLVWETVRPWL